APAPQAVSVRQAAAPVREAAKSPAPPVVTPDPGPVPPVPPAPHVIVHYDHFPLGPGHVEEPVWTQPGDGSLGSNYLSDVSFAGATHGWAVGGWNGFILATTDGGESWEQQDSGTNAELTGVSFVDRNRGWAVGFNGTILSTRNGGETWSHQSSPGGDYLAVSFVDRTHGWAVGNCGVISATTDGGATWISQVPPPAPITCANATLTDVEFVDRNHGWAVGGDVVLSTTDGGTTWSAQSVPASLYDAYFVDARRGWAVGFNTVLATTDGGDTWVDLGLDLENTALLGVAFANRNVGWVVGSALNGDQIILATTDGGDTWTAESAEATPMLRAVAAVSAEKATAVGTAILVR
ncbi:MAG TPA: YCF48-related protein, partial [Acidimicrobiales bacterium]